MQTYREIQAARWQKQQVATTVVEPEDTDYPEHLHAISYISIDKIGLESIMTAGCTRVGVMFGAVTDDHHGIIVDAIYELPLDSVTGQVMKDTRLSKVVEISNRMGLHPVGIFIYDTGGRTTEFAGDLLRVVNLQGARCHNLTIAGVDLFRSIIPTPKCFSHAKRGTLTPDTTLKGPTVDGGLDGASLYRNITCAKREVNMIIHAGFYRLNRPNHTPTMNDVRTFLLARREKAGIDKLHQQIADYHLILFLADVLGENTAERIIIAIFTEDDELLEDLFEVLMSSRY